MARWHQTWTCSACKHVFHETVRYPKYGASETPLTEVAKRARCPKCNALGTCTITEKQAGRE